MLAEESESQLSYCTPPPSRRYLRVDDLPLHLPLLSLSSPDRGWTGPATETIIWGISSFSLIFFFAVMTWRRWRRLSARVANYVGGMCVGWLSPASAPHRLRCYYSLCDDHDNECETIHIGDESWSEIGWQQRVWYGCKMWMRFNKAPGQLNQKLVAFVANKRGTISDKLSTIRERAVVNFEARFSRALTWMVIVFIISQ